MQTTATRDLKLRAFRDPDGDAPALMGMVGRGNRPWCSNRNQGKSKTASCLPDVIVQGKERDLR